MLNGVNNYNAFHIFCFHFSSRWIGHYTYYSIDIEKKNKTLQHNNVILEEQSVHSSYVDTPQLTTELLDRFIILPEVEFFINGYCLLIFIINKTRSQPCFLLSLT